MSGSAPSRVLVRLPNPAGDVVLATPALRALRAALPDAHVTWAGMPSALDLLDGPAGRDGADATFAVEGRTRRGPLAPWRCGRAWRRDGVDAVVVMPDSVSSALAALASGAGVRVGHARRGRPRFLTRAVRGPTDASGRPAPEPMTARYLRLAAALGGVDDGRGPRLAVTAAGEAAARERLAALGIDGPFLAVSPGAAFGRTKIYPARHLADVVRRVRERTGCAALVLCAPGEEALAADVAARADACSTHLRPARWPEAKALLARATLLLTPDAGPRHVAAALGTPVVAVLGPTDPAWTRGDEATTVVVRNEAVSCLGCHLRECPIGHPCMEDLAPEAVAAACLARLAARA